MSIKSTKLKYACCLALLLMPVVLHAASADAGNEDVTRYAIPADAIKNGPKTTRYPNKQVYAYFLPGTNGKHGPVVAREYYENQQLVERDLYKNEQKHGYQTEWYPNGRMKKRETFNNGVRDGTLDYWDEAGDLVGHTVFKAGTGWRRVYNSDGVMILEECFADNWRNGISMEYYPHGNIRSIAWRKNDRIAGIAYSFYNDVDPRVVTFYASNGDWNGPYVMYPPPIAGLTAKVPEQSPVQIQRMGEFKPRWAINDHEVTEAQYAAAAALDQTLPPYFVDPNAYKKLVDVEALKALQRYRTMPRVKIPLEFDNQGNPVAAKIQPAPDIKKDEH